MKTNTLRCRFLTTMAIILAIASPVIYADDAKEPPKTEVLSVMTGDWNQDKNIDSAVLMKNDEIVELYIYLGNKKNEQQQVLYKEDIAWSGEMDGTKPYLETKGKKSSLFIHSENDAVGRNRWNQVLTIAYRDKSFLVSGYTYDARDTLDPENNSSCDVNLFTGKGVKNKKAFKIAAQKIKLKGWSEENIPKPCE